jgi:hypothetical protein
MRRNFEHEPHIAQLLLDLTDSLEIGGTVKGVAAHEEQLDEIPCNITASDVQSAGKVRKSKAIIHRHDVCHAVSGVDNDAGRQTCTS